MEKTCRYWGVGHSSDKSDDVVHRPFGTRFVKGIYLEVGTC